MKQKRILNICMVLTIIFTIGCGIMAVGSVKGWFAEEDAFSTLTVSEKTGIAMVERSGVAYEVTADTSLEKKDRLYTKPAAALAVSSGERTILRMGSNAELSVTDMEQALQLDVTKGNVLGDARDVNDLILTSNRTKINMNHGVAAVSTQAGATTVYVYAGEVTLGETDDTSDKVTAIPAGKKAVLVDGEEQYEISKLTVNHLSDEQIGQLLTCGLDDTFCFTESDLNNTQEDRKKETKTEQKNAVKADESTKAYRTEEQKTGADKETEEDKTEEAKSNPQENGNAAPEKNPTCTIKIVCDTILDNKEDFTPGKEGYVPSSGVILGTTEVEFTDGETVFDVLQRACDKNGIQIEYSYTPIYESYYIEGMNHIYEFDCGPESGWMYKVNGWFPNYGCSSYYVEEGDSIVWCYSCKGLGADVGGSNF